MSLDDSGVNFTYYSSRTRAESVNVGIVTKNAFQKKLDFIEKRKRFRNCGMCSWSFRFGTRGWGWGCNLTLITNKLLFFVWLFITDIIIMDKIHVLNEYTLIKEIIIIISLSCLVTNAHVISSANENWWVYVNKKTFCLFNHLNMKSKHFDNRFSV
jgi:hypothetical protein